MRNPFRSRPVEASADPVAAEGYREGRVDERRRMAADGGVAPGAATVGKAELETAYAQGRERERATRRRGGSPLLSLVVLLAVVVAAGFIYLAVRHGSFSNGGAVLDQEIDTAAHTVNAPIKNAAVTTGEALQRAGEKLK
jgi:flagellin-like protein